MALYNAVPQGTTTLGYRMVHHLEKEDSCDVDFIVLQAGKGLKRDIVNLSSSIRWLLSRTPLTSIHTQVFRFHLKRINYPLYHNLNNSKIFIPYTRGRQSGKWGENKEMDDKNHLWSFKLSSTI